MLKQKADVVAKIEDEEGNLKLLNLDQFGITEEVIPEAGHDL